MALQLAYITWPQADQHPSAFKLCKALRELESPIYVTDGIAKTWFKVYYGDCTSFFSAGKLELKYGEQIRVQHLGAPMIAESMMLWLRKTHKVWDVGVTGDICGICHVRKIRSQLNQKILNMFSVRFLHDTSIQGCQLVHLLDEAHHTTTTTSTVRCRCSTK